MNARLAALWARFGAHALAVAVACALVICAVIAWPTHPAPAPRPVPAAVVRADSAAAKADSAHARVMPIVQRHAYTYDGARAKVPAFSTADSLGRIAVDTGFVTKADSVRASVPLLEAADIQRHSADSAQVAALRGFTVDLQRDLAHSEPRCRLLGLPCPSRKTAFEGGVALGVLLVVAVAAHR